MKSEIRGENVIVIFDTRVYIYYAAMMRLEEGRGGGIHRTGEK